MVQIAPLLEGEPKISDEDAEKAIPISLTEPSLTPFPGESLQTLTINEAELDQLAERNELPKIQAAISHPKE